MNRSLQLERMTEMMFALTPQSVAFRKQWRMILFIAVWFILSGLTMILTFIGVSENIWRLILAALSFLKYAPIIYVAYRIAKNVCAKYLQDIYELEDEEIAVTFLDKVAFGYDDEDALEHGGRIWNGDGQSIIKITEGEISEADQETTIVQIGGPGHVQVNLGNVVLFEKISGAPEIMHARGKPWKISRFERIREIGDAEYAIINLSDQFLTDLSVNSRTKDGIPLGAHDIKIMFRVLRRQEETDDTDDAALLYDPEAVKALVYEQTIVRPEPLEEKSAFPWNTTVLRLIQNELEDLIRKHTLAEILASIGQKEIDQALVNQDSVEQIRNELTRQQKAIPRDSKPMNAPKFTSRSMITSQFYSREFKEKAAKTGISLEWIDIGTWKHPPAPIFDKLQEAWKKAGDNASKKTDAERKKGKTANEEFIKLVNSAIIEKFEQPKNTSHKKDHVEKAKESETVFFEEYNNFARKFGEVVQVEKSPNTIALDILKAIRKELLAGKELLDIEFIEDPSLEDKRALDNIEKVIRDINLLEMHWLK